MPAPPVNLYPDESKMARLRRELRNPSMMTIGIIIVAFLALPLGILGPSWVSTTRESLDRRTASDELRERTILSANVQVPSQIVPWMLNEIERMANATSPASWKAVDFKQGPCNVDNLSQLPAGPYADAISKACVDLDAIQTQFSGTCVSVATCALPDEAITRTIAVRSDLVLAFSDAGFVLPYSEDEQDVGP